MPRAREPSRCAVGARAWGEAVIPAEPIVLCACALAIMVAEIAGAPIRVVAIAWAAVFGIGAVRLLVVARRAARRAVLAGGAERGSCLAVWRDREGEQHACGETEGHRGPCRCVVCCVAREARSGES